MIWFIFLVKKIDKYHSFKNWTGSTCPTEWPSGWIADSMNRVAGSSLYSLGQNGSCCWALNLGSARATTQLTSRCWASQKYKGILFSMPFRCHHYPIMTYVSIFTSTKKKDSSQNFYNNKNANNLKKNNIIFLKL